MFTACSTNKRAVILDVMFGGWLTPGVDGIVFKGDVTGFQCEFDLWIKGQSCDAAISKLNLFELINFIFRFLWCKSHHYNFRVLGVIATLCGC